MNLQMATFHLEKNISSSNPSQIELQNVLGALVIQYSPISPMKALFWSAVINGVVAVPLMVAILVLASKASVMGPHTAGKILLFLGWFATALMALAAILMFVG